MADEATRVRLVNLQQPAVAEPAEVGATSDSSRVTAPTAETLQQLLEVVVAQQKSAAAAITDLATKKSELEVERAGLSAGRLEGGPPYSILLLDQIRDAQRDNQVKRESADATLLTARQAVEIAGDVAKQRAQEFRQIKERVGADTESDELKIPEQNVELADAVLELRRQELSIAQANADISNLQIEIDNKRAEIVEAQTEFSREMLTDKLAEIDSREITLKRDLNALQSELLFAERRWVSARQEADATAEPGVDLKERLNALKSAEQAIRSEEGVVNQRLQRLPELRETWNRRFLIATGQADRVQQRTWLEESRKLQDQWRRERRLRELKLAELRVSQSSVDTRIDELGEANSELKRWLQQGRDAINRQIKSYEDDLTNIDAAARTIDQLALQIEGKGKRTFREISDDFLSSTKRVWNYELTSIDDTSVTIGKVLSSLLLLVFGFAGARWLSRLLANRLPKMGVEEAAVDAIESLSFYALLVAFSLTALRYANVPLTVFTFLGGAIAIGVGFGSQNILNNFISGLILLAERPIKAGDLIKLGETYGNVSKIGARSTQIRTGENQDIIVPNSRFLENDVTNLTRRDDRLRTSITVGVAYGSALDKVITCLEQAASESAGVHERPKPMVWFNDFGDNALVFQVHFWITARTVAQMKTIETRVRLAIDRLFRENGIVIAFPQRDLHLNTTQPLEFRVIDQAEEVESGGLGSLSDSRYAE